MKSITVTNWKGKEISGEWNEKFYEAQVEGDSTGIYRIYLNNERVHITEQEKERILNNVSKSKIEEDNARIKIILQEFDKLDDNAKKLLVETLEVNIMSIKN